MDPLNNELADSVKPPVTAPAEPKDREGLKRYLEAAAIAFRAVYLSGYYGNVRCAEAVREIERTLEP